MNETLLKVIITAVRYIFNICIIAVSAYLIYHFTTIAYDFAKGISGAAIVEEKSAREVVVTIPNGATTKDVAVLLKEAGLTENVEWFRLQSRIDGMDGLYRSGTYTLNTNMGDEELMEILTKGTDDLETITITIPEGYTAAQIGEYLEETGLFTADEFRRAMNEGSYDYSFLAQVPERNTRLEGYLFPDTYFVAKDSTPEEIISKMLSRFEQVYLEEERTKTVSLPLDEVVTRASIVEAEIRVPAERAVCASVIQNRLDIGMALQMDATVQYALGERKKRLLIVDLEVDSPYNTYKNTGLPLGPICNPGRASINAVLNPKTTDYVYYVLNDIEAGTHEFVATYDEFLSAKAKYKDLIE